jgi:hypothetical protein
LKQIKFEYSRPKDIKREKYMKIKIRVLVGILFIAPLGVSAHHSFSVHYFPEQIVMVTGTLTSARIRSPHSFLTVDVEGENGEVVTWDIETHAVPLIRRMGLVADDFKIGETITVAGMASRIEGKPLILGLDFTMADGNTYSWRPDTLVAEGGLSEAGTVAATGLDRFQGAWGYEVDPNPHINAESPLPLNQAGLDARVAFDPLDTSALRCIPPHLPSLLYVPYLYNIQIVGDELRLQHEYFEILRTVRLDGQATKVDSGEMYGTAVARVEDDAIIIESTGFPNLAAGLASDFDPNGVGTDIPSSDQKRFTERYTVSDDGLALTAEYTIEDPGFLTGTYTNSTVWQRLADGTELVPFECDADMAAQSTSQGGG